VGLQKDRERSERLAAVADRRFPVAGFSERLPVRRVEEDRVVAEAAVASRLGRDAAFDSPARLEQHAGAFRKRNRTDEPRAPRRVQAAGRPVGAERPVDQLEFVRVRRVCAAVARRFDAGRTVERVDCQAGIFRHGQLAGRGRVVQRLGARILLERSPGLLGRRNQGPLRERHDVKRKPVEQLTDFTHFVVIGRRDKKTGHPSESTTIMAETAEHAEQVHLLRVQRVVGLTLCPKGWPQAATRRSAARGIWEGGSAGWLTAQRKDLRPADGRAFLIRGKIVTSKQLL